jgi:hypothetical protein
LSETDVRDNYIMSADDETTRQEPAAETSRTRHDWDRDGSVATSVIESVSAVTGDAPPDIDPLYDALDPDALDALVASLRNGSGGTVSFRFNGCDVTVDSAGRIAVRRPE